MIDNFCHRLVFAVGEFTCLLYVNINKYTLPEQLIHTGLFVIISATIRIFEISYSVVLLCI